MRKVLITVGVLLFVVLGGFLSFPFILGGALLGTPVQQSTTVTCSTGTLSAPVKVTLTSAQLSSSQLYYAQLIIGVAKGRHLSARVAAISVATAMQESSLSNPTVATNYDSLGLFQQRPSQGWGTPAQLTDPVYASNAFFDALVKLPNVNNPNVPITVLAQAVQHSGLPNAYQQWAPMALQLAAQGYGQSAGGNQITLAATNGCTQASASVGPYKDPLRAVQGLRPERVDQGVDYAGSGPVYALGDGVITNLTNTGWNYGGYDAYIVEHLTDGPAAGKDDYVAEACVPTLQQSQLPIRVSANTVICNLIPGGTGIETGWADTTGASPESQTQPAGSISGASSCILVSVPTLIGLNYDQLLQAVGAPGGTTQPGTCGLMPSGWPTWSKN